MIVMELLAFRERVKELRLTELSLHLGESILGVS